MRERPVETDFLVCGHARAAFREGGDGKGVREGKRGARGGLEEGKGGDGGVFVFVAATLTYVL